MKTKLTLTIEQILIEKAKSYAKDKGKSLSDLVENYLKLLTKEEKTALKVAKTSKIQSLRGNFKQSGQLDYKKEISNSLAKKYLK